MSRVANIGCLICQSPAEIHHIGNMTLGKKSSNYEIIPLCHFHHRTGGHGEAIHAGKKTWEEKYGTEQELLAKTKEILNAW